MCLRYLRQVLDGIVYDKEVAIDVCCQPTPVTSSYWLQGIREWEAYQVSSGAICQVQASGRNNS